MKRALLLLFVLAATACGSGESGVVELRVVGADGAPIAGAEVLYLAELREEPYGGLAIPPLNNARALAGARVTTIADGTARLETSGVGGLLVLAKHRLPSGYLLADDLPKVDGALQLALRDGGSARARAIGPGADGEESAPIPGLVLSTWLHNKATTAFGHDLLVYAEEVAPGQYDFPGLASVQTPWTDGSLREVATIQVAGYSATGAVRETNDVFLVELGQRPEALRLRYDGGEGLPTTIHVEVQAVAAPVAEALPVLGPEDPPLWCVFGAPLAAGATGLYALAAWDTAVSAVFLVQVGEHGSFAFAMPLAELDLGADAEPFNLTQRVRDWVGTTP